MRFIKIVCLMFLVTATVDFIDDLGNGLVSVWVSYKNDGIGIRSEIYTISRRYNAVEAFKNVDMPKYKAKAITLPNDYRPARKVNRESIELENLKAGDIF